MFGSGRVKAVGVGAIGVLALASSGALAATAPQPTLKVKVVPTVVKPKGKFKVYLTVTYDKKTMTTRPYLRSYVQLSGAACKPAAKAEASVSSTQADFLGTVTNSPFTRWDGWTAGSRRGTRRVCAYLYAAKSDPRPLLTATATYRVT
jgi:hypothetical protein